jgi:uncharacterized protein (TIGR03437 family)
MIKSILTNLPLCLTVWAIGLTSSCLGQSVLWQPGSTEPRIQLTGESFQISSNGFYFTDLILGLTMSQYGVLGVDLGFPVVYPDKILFLFGDTLATYASNGASGLQYFLSLGSGADDSIGYIPNMDLSQCHYIANVDQQLAQGNPKPSIDATQCPAMQFYVNPNHGPQQHAFQAIDISGLEPGEGTGPFETPSGGVDFNNKLYMFYITKIQDATPHFALQSILARADQQSSTLSSSNPPTFTRLYTVSTHPAITDPNNPPAATNDYGKFMFNPPLVMDAATLSSNALTPGLPAALQSASNVVFVFGSSWLYNRSNLYLAAFSLSDIEAGTSNWFYYAGQNGGVNVWSNDEKAAAPLLAGSPNVGNHSVIWDGTLHRFVLMYGNIAARAAAAPWGPWSSGVVVFDPQSAWAKKLIHHPGADMITRSVIPIFNPATGMQTDLNSSDTGVPYSPNLIKSTQNADGSVALFFAMSTWNPYEVFLVSSNFTLGPQHAPLVSAASFDGSSVAPGSIVTLFGQGLAAATASGSTPDLPTSLAGRMVNVEDSSGTIVAAQLYYVSPTQISFVMPPGIALGPATINVIDGSSLVNSITTNVTTVAPALFSANANGSGAASAYVLTNNAGGKSTLQPTFVCGSSALSCVPNPIDISGAMGGAFLELYGTGIRLAGGLAAVSAAIGGVPAAVSFAGPQSQYPGMDQVNISIPSQLQGRGEVPVTLLVAGNAVNTVLVAFK